MGWSDGKFLVDDKDRQQILGASHRKGYNAGCRYFSSQINHEVSFQEKLSKAPGSFERERAWFLYYVRWKDHQKASSMAESHNPVCDQGGGVVAGREIREQMFSEVKHLLHDLDAGLLPISVFFPYLPIPKHRARDR
jgi:hypothetical protein